jgi:hypothetical protein
VTEIKIPEKFGLPAVPVTAPINAVLSKHCPFCPLADSEAKPYAGQCATSSSWKIKDDFYKNIARFSYLINV